MLMLEELTAVDLMAPIPRGQQVDDTSANLLSVMGQ